MAFVCAWGLAWAQLASADDARALLNNYSMTTSLFFEGGVTDYSGFRNNYSIAPRGVGVRYTERNGMISGTIAAVIVMAASVVSSVGTVKSTREFDSGGYRYSETTYYSQAEQDERRERAANAGGAQASAAIGSPTQSFDLQLFSRNMGGNATGFMAKLMVFSFLQSERSRLDVGLIFGKVSTATDRDFKSLLTHASTAGIALRYNVALGPVLTYAEFDANWFGIQKPATDVTSGNALAHDVRNLPWHVGASTAVFHRLFVDVAVTTPRLFSG
ncbi:MAG: hypothetical protein EXR77_11240 [Myxococcales bacterium]|nr:hypothetical protein [Myxococcales bacterium]